MTFGNTRSNIRRYKIEAVLKSMAFFLPFNECVFYFKRSIAQLSFRILKFIFLINIKIIFAYLIVGYG